MVQVVLAALGFIVFGGGAVILPQFFLPKILLQHCYFIVLMSLQSEFCTGSADPGSGELIWATFEVWFSYIGPERYLYTSGQLMLGLFESQARYVSGSSFLFCISSEKSITL
jgi:hypothetical protein